MSVEVATTGPGRAGTYTGRTAWARNVGAPVRDFLSAETGSAVFLLGATIAALVWANSPWSHSYQSFWTTKLSIQIGGGGISTDLRHWVNEGLMTFFFLVVGLEAKRELDVGQLRERRRLAVPLFAAIGGMALPILIYLAVSAGGSGAHGWGTAMSTDTAFALGVLALIAPGGTRLRIRLLTVAVFDDLVALAVIATAYTKHVSVVPLAVAVGIFAALLLLRYAPAVWRRQVAFVLGVAAWVALFKSGIDPIIAGLAAGLVTSAYPPSRSDLERVTELTRTFRETPTPELARSAERSVASAISANERLQYRLHPWTSFVIVPVFALANAGIHFHSGLLSDAVGSPITLGIFFGYVVGKPVGIFGAAWLVTRQRIGRGLRPALSWPEIAGAGAVGGVGFTVSLLIASIAFHGRQLDEAKIGILAAGVASALVAWAIFRTIEHLPPSMRARQIIGTAEELLDLSGDVNPERDHIRGPTAAPVTLVEYGDYQCPYCGQAEVAIRELLESFGDDLRYVWRQLPLNDVHEYAQVAAEAAEAAGSQGAFWAMHDKLLDNQEALRAPDLTRYAEELGLDVDQFWDEVSGRAHAERISEDVATADASGVAGTPSFFINGKRYAGAYDIDTLTEAVRAARKRALLNQKAEATA